MASLLQPAPATLVGLEEYHRQPERNANGRRTEFIRGVVTEKPVRSPRHARLLRRLFRLAQAAAGPGMLVFKEDPLTFIDSEPEPDVSIVTGDSGDFCHAHPDSALLVIAVSVSSRVIDRREAAIYAEAGHPGILDRAGGKGGIGSLHRTPKQVVHAAAPLLSHGDGCEPCAVRLAGGPRRAFRRTAAFRPPQLPLVLGP